MRLSFATLLVVVVSLGEFVFVLGSKALSRQPGEKKNRRFCRFQFRLELLKREIPFSICFSPLSPSLTLFPSNS
jgi:hypothetical protein